MNDERLGHGMYCRECKWFESGYTSNSSGVCVARGVKVYPNHFCWLSSDLNRRTKSCDKDNSVGQTIGECDD